MCVYNCYFLNGAKEGATDVELYQVMSSFFDIPQKFYVQKVCLLLAGSKHYPFNKLSFEFCVIITINCYNGHFASEWKRYKIKFTVDCLLFNVDNI